MRDRHLYNRHLYRGVPVDYYNYGDWQFGWLYSYTPCGYEEQHFILPIDTEIMIESELASELGVRIKPETIGQCTGRRDKKGRLIFEHDLVSYDTSFFEVVWGWDGWRLLSFDEDLTFKPGSSWEDMEIAGNSHSNPELVDKLIRDEIENVNDTSELDRMWAELWGQL